MKFYVAIAIVLAMIMAAVSTTEAASILWTGYAHNGQWNTANNWYPAQIPSSGDDVTIHTGAVQATSAVAVNSLLMGDHLEGKANLTVFNSFSVGTTLKCYQNGNIILSSGSSALFGTVTIQGGLTFASGSVTGAVTVTGTADLSGAAAKTVTEGSLSLNGPSTVAGVISLTKGGNFNIGGKSNFAATTIIQGVNNTNGGFDFSTGTVTIAADLSVQSAGSFGALTLNNAVNLTIYDQVTFANTLNIPHRSDVTTFGSASVTVALSGSGRFISNGASTTFNAQSFDGIVACHGASCTFSGKTNSVYNLVAATGAVKIDTGCAFNATSFLNVLSAQISNAGSVVTDQLNLAGDAGVLVAGSIQAKNMWVFVDAPDSFSVNGAIIVTSALNAEKGSFTFGPSGSVTVAKAASGVFSGAFSFTGPSNAPGFVNNGAISAKGGLSSTNINLAGTGSWSFSGDQVKISGAEFAASKLMLASGASLVGSNACINVGSIAAGTVKAKIDQFSFTCNGSCSDVVAPCSPMPADSFSFSS